MTNKAHAPSELRAELLTAISCLAQRIEAGEIDAEYLEEMDSNCIVIDRQGRPTPEAVGPWPFADAWFNHNRTKLIGYTTVVGTDTECEASVPVDTKGYFQ